MEKKLTIACAALLMLAACQEQTFYNEDDKEADRVPIGIESATASATKALLSPGVQTTVGMEIGLFAAGADYYTAESSTNHSAVFTYASGSGWQPEANIYLTAALANIYGYYPSTATLVKDATDPKLMVSVLPTGEITPVSANSSGEWRAAATGGEADVNGKTIIAGTSGWFNKPSDDKSQYQFAAATGEIDYMAFVPAAGKGRLANNGKANNGTPTESNLGLNPGYTIPALTLEHGMAMVSFRLCNDGTYRGKADWTKLVLKNATGKQVLTQGTTPQMKLADASMIPGVFKTVDITRTIPTTQYKVPRVVVGGTSSATVVTTEAEARAAAAKVSCLVLPITTAFAAGDMQIVLTVDGVNYPPINIPATAPANVWKRGENYIYTLRIGGKGLSISSVTIAGWKDVDAGDIPVN